MDTATTPAFVHIADERKNFGRRETMCQRVALALSENDIIYDLDEEPKTPTCLWCAAERKY